MIYVDKRVMESRQEIADFRSHFSNILVQFSTNAETLRRTGRAEY